MKVGDYIRYKNCIMKTIFIAKIIEIKKADNIIKEKCYILDNKDACLRKHIIGQPSFYPIDLIQVGDYVNGYKVVDKGKYEYDDNQSYIVIDFDTDNDELHWGDEIELVNNEIKSIVTKEQFEQMEYKVGE